MDLQAAYALHPGLSEIALDTHTHTPDHAPGTINAMWGKHYTQTNSKPKAGDTYDAM